MGSKKAKREAAIDEEIGETFPASDPPAFMAGSIGAPKNRRTPKRKVPAKRKAVKKTKAKKRKK